MKDGTVKLMKGERVILEEGYFGKKCRNQIVEKWMKIYGLLSKGKLAIQISPYEGPHSQAREDKWDKIITEKFAYKDLVNQKKV